VTSRGAAFRFKGRESDLAAVRRKLGVRAVVTGRVVLRGENVSINAELADASDGHQSIELEPHYWPGAPATNGIKDMAERGLTSTLAAEINAAIAARTAEHVFTGGNIADSPGSAIAEFEISRDYSLVTLVSMIAPSPDWFVGVSAVSLFQDGRWSSSRRFDLDPWDAGTDGGVTFNSADLSLAPRLAITRIVTSPLSPAGRVTSLGTFTFVRLQ
jgi:hypothetical protein